MDKDKLFQEFHEIAVRVALDEATDGERARLVELQDMLRVNYRPSCQCGRYVMDVRLSDEQLKRLESLRDF